MACSLQKVFFAGTTIKGIKPGKNAYSRGLVDKDGRVFKTKRFHPVLNFVIIIIIIIDIYNFD